ncbi:hypothetical protein AB1K70_12035 [Bremerella sp. JC770]|uniref:hypothetical protein n=1 Tax=Bremerella sp. JC770 TaxID=3232137 RepID=UPI003459A862
MDYEHARALLLMHSGRIDIDPEEVQPGQEFPGYLNHLRPFRGTVNRACLHEIFQALFVVRDRWAEQEYVEGRLVAAVWDIARTTLHWAIYPEGMLPRNKLINESDAELLKCFHLRLENLSIRALEDADLIVFVSGYCEFVRSFGMGENIEFFLPYMVSYIEDPDIYEVESVAVVLGQMGARAATALPGLKSLAMSPMPLWCVESREAVLDAVEKIETQLENST